MFLKEINKVLRKKNGHCTQKKMFSSNVLISLNLKVPFCSVYPTKKKIKFQFTYNQNSTVIYLYKHSVNCDKKL